MSTDLPTLYDPGVFRPGETKLPSVYVQQKLSQLVDAGATKPGDVVASLAADDVDFEWLLGGPEKLEHFDAWVIGVRRTVVRQAQGEQMKFLSDTYERARDERDIWVGFTYLLAIPALENFPGPVRLMAIKTAGKPVFTKINFELESARARGEGHQPLGMRFTVREKSGKESGLKYHGLEVARIPSSEISEDDVSLAQMYLQGFAESFKSQEYTAIESGGSTATAERPSL